MRVALRWRHHGAHKFMEEMAKNANVELALIESRGCVLFSIERDFPTIREAVDCVKMVRGTSPASYRQVGGLDLYVEHGGTFLHIEDYVALSDGWKSKVAVFHDLDFDDTHPLAGHFGERE